MENKYKKFSREELMEMLINANMELKRFMPKNNWIDDQYSEYECDIEECDKDSYWYLRDLDYRVESIRAYPGGFKHSYFKHAKAGEFKIYDNKEEAEEDSKFLRKYLGLK